MTDKNGQSQDIRDELSRKIQDGLGIEKGAADAILDKFIGAVTSELKAPRMKDFGISTVANFCKVFGEKHQIQLAVVDTESGSVQVFSNLPPEKANHLAAAIHKATEMATGDGDDQGNFVGKGNAKLQ